MESGTINSASIWNATDTADFLVDDVAVGVGSTLTVNPGVVVKFENGKSLFVQGTRKIFPSSNNGPLCVASSDGVTPILASERFISTYLNSASYSEMMGFPRNRLDDTYWFPWYNNINYETELRIAKP